MVSELKKCCQNGKHYEPLQISSLVLQNEGAWFLVGAKISTLPSSGSVPVNKPWTTIQTSLCLPKLTPNFEDTELVDSQVTILLPVMVFFFPPGMLTDWRALHRAVRIFFHIFHRRFK